MTTVDHEQHECEHDWCLAHRACDCPYSSVQPHSRAGCRYATDDEDQDSRIISRTDQQ